ncbi:unnamed protein product [Cylindrotheca closterium]|uniref:PIG-P domain-containing protein n=1 Tax=Cylindrotheca closterium TaxID=2856 RepID=A0AAD2FLS2_9STRA|nr:unnamed protein product [Cylindrotheca closterium]
MEKKTSVMEKCSLICHLLTFPIGLLYSLWILLPDEDLEALNITYYPPKQWAFNIPLVALILFFAIPIAYVWLNSLTVPATTSSDLLEDQYTRRPTTTIKRQKGIAPHLPLPEICDLDPAGLVWYPNKSD